MLLCSSDPNSSFGLFFLGSETGQGSCLLAQHNQVLIKPGEGLDVESGKRCLWMYTCVYMHNMNVFNYDQKEQLPFLPSKITTNIPLNKICPLQPLPLILAHS